MKWDNSYRNTRNILDFPTRAFGPSDPGMRTPPTGGAAQRAGSWERASLACEEEEESRGTVLTLGPNRIRGLIARVDLTSGYSARSGFGRADGLRLAA